MIPGLSFFLQNDSFLNEPASSAFGKLYSLWGGGCLTVTTLDYILDYSRCSTTIFIDREAREIMHLVASVRPSVCLRSHGWTVWPTNPSCNTFWDMNYYPVNFGNVTDRQTDRQKVMHMSPSCKMHRWAKNISAVWKNNLVSCFPFHKEMPILIGIHHPIE